MTTTNNSKPVRRTFKVGDCPITFNGCVAYIDAIAAEFAATTEHVVSARALVKESAATATGQRLVVRIATDLTQGEVEIAINSTSALDVRKLRETFAKRLDKLVVKEREQLGGCRRKSRKTKESQLMNRIAELEALVASLRAA